MQHAQRLPDEALQKRVHDGLLQLQNQIRAAPRLRFVDVLHLRRGGTLLGGEGEDAGALDLRLAQKCAQLLEFRLALTGQARNQARAQHETRDAPAQRAKQGADLPAGAPAVHLFQDAVVDVLDRDIQILHDLVVARDLVNQLLVELVGVEVVEPDPFDPLDLAQLAAEPREAPLAVEVGAVARDVLRDDDQLFHPVRGQIPRLLQNMLDRPRAVAPADIRDRAEGAEVVAALRDAQIGPARPGGHDARQLLHRGVFIPEGGVALAGADAVRGLDDLAEAADAEHGVDLRELLEDAVLIALGEAAGDDDAAKLPLGLELCER